MKSSKAEKEEPKKQTVAIGLFGNLSPLVSIGLVTHHHS